MCIINPRSRPWPWHVHNTPKTLVIAPQTLIEFYVTCTRTHNGLGLTPDQTILEMEDLKREYPLLAETPSIFSHWEALIRKHKPTNRRVFNARHVAFMIVHQIPRILTFNDQDFAPYTEIQAVNPFDLLKLPRQ